MSSNDLIDKLFYFFSGISYLPNLLLFNKSKCMHAGI